MPVFQYEALSMQGQREKGHINASSLQEAKTKLQAKSLFLTDIKEKRLHQKQKQLSNEALYSFTRELSQLLGSGLPLYESLKTIEEKHRGDRSHALFSGLCDDVEKGKAFSKSLSFYPKTFSEVYLALVAAGEKTGKLKEVFVHLSNMLNKQQKIKKQVRTALVYPCFLLAFCCFITVFLFFFLIPSMAQLFEGRTLHPLTQVVMSMSQFLNAHATTFFLSVFLSVSGLILFFKTKSGKKLLQTLSLYLPIIKTINQSLIFLRISQSLAALLSNGITLLEALQLSNQAVSHYKYKGALHHARDKLMEGKALSVELENTNLFPKLIIRMIATAEKSGNMDQMFMHIASIYEEDLEKNIQQLLQLLQPIMILLLGIIVGFVLLSILLPLTDVSSFLN